MVSELLNFKIFPNGTPHGHSPFLKFGLAGLFIATVIFGYHFYKSRYLPAFGNHTEESRYLEQADPRALVGGSLTHFKFGTNGFAEEAVNLPWQLSKMFDDGDGVFERPFTPASPSSQGSNADGLGPIFNNISCESCHANDGRSMPIPGIGLLVRVSVPGTDIHGGPKGHPAYGGQFGDHAVRGVAAEGTVDITYEEIQGTYGDGQPYILHKPTIHLTDLNYGPLGDDVMLSARAPIGVYGGGLLEAISDTTLQEWADEEDRDNDGISGKINIVHDMYNDQMAYGRFGWKAEASSLINQAAAAAANDMGVTSPVLPHQECTSQQQNCQNSLHGGDQKEPEFTLQQLLDLEAYLRFLSVPARGHLDNPIVQKGENLFTSAGCSSCHKQHVVTGNDHPMRRLRNQKIQPYTDLLLHDMGDGLADNRPSYKANGREWRTHPLWGIGMVETVNGHTMFLHDGRANGYAEAILWHGGEAEPSKEFFRNLSKKDREAMIAFLKSL